MKPCRVPGCTLAGLWSPVVSCGGMTFNIHGIFACGGHRATHAARDFLSPKTWAKMCDAMPGLEFADLAEATLTWRVAQKE